MFGVFKLQFPSISVSGTLTIMTTVIIIRLQTTVIHQFFPIAEETVFKETATHKYSEANWLPL